MLGPRPQVRPQRGCRHGAIGRAMDGEGVFGAHRDVAVDQLGDQLLGNTHGSRQVLLASAAGFDGAVNVGGVIGTGAG